METETKPQSPRDQLRDRLLEMRNQLIDRLATQITGGDLTLLANVQRRSRRSSTI
jgi:hypothetical protein